MFSSKKVETMKKKPVSLKGINKFNSKSIDKNAQEQIKGGGNTIKIVTDGMSNNP